MNYHIINCDNISNALAGGFIAVGMAFDNSTGRKLSNSCRTNYSMFADMKTVAPGDMVFVHAGEFIYGAFEAASTFMEDPTIYGNFRSGSIHYNANPNVQGSGWRNLVGNNIALPPADVRQLSIGHFKDDAGNNLCYHNGFLANEVFDLRRRGKIWSIPERWKYPDSARIIRPIVESEAEELLALLERENSDEKNKVMLTPKDMSSTVNINLILNPAIVEDEKILEAWICEQFHGDNLDHIFGRLSSFGNNVQIGYLQGIDILGIQKTKRIQKYKVIELKLGDLTFAQNSDVFKQVLGYMDWIMAFLANNDPKCVEGFIVANNFDESYIEFCKSHNKVNFGRQVHLVRYLYLPPTYNCLCLGFVV